VSVSAAGASNHSLTDRSFQRLSNKRFRGDGDQLRARLVNAWAHEQVLYLVGHDDP
jgi:hypothetical protein